MEYAAIEALNKSSITLLNVLVGFLNRGIELERLSRVVWALSETNMHLNSALRERILKTITSQQKPDGGWTGIFDTMWNIVALKKLACGKELKSIQAGYKFLHNNRNPDGGWGRSLRDFSRIPVTGALLWLLPELRDENAYVWLHKEWNSEWNPNSDDISLTYKGAFTILAHSGKDLKSLNNIFGSTLDWLISQQDPNGGFGPWKGHPIGTVPSITGPVLTSLTFFQSKDDAKSSIKRAVKHIIDSQLLTGFWADHYIEVGSAYIHYALYKACLSKLEMSK